MKNIPDFVWYMVVMALILFGSLAIPSITEYYEREQEIELKKLELIEKGCLDADNL